MEEDEEAEEDGEKKTGSRDIALTPHIGQYFAGQQDDVNLYGCPGYALIISQLNPGHPGTFLYICNSSVYTHTNTYNEYKYIVSYGP